MALACGVRTFGDRDLELASSSRRVTCLVSTPLAGGDRLLQAAALVHRGRGDDAVLVRQRFHVLQFPAERVMNLLLLSELLIASTWNPAKVGLRPATSRRICAFRASGTLELPFVAHAAQKLDANSLRASRLPSGSSRNVSIDSSSSPPKVGR